MNYEPNESGILLSNFKAKGTLNIVLRNEDNKIIHKQRYNNLVVNIGLAHLASRLKDNSATAMGWMAVGTSNTAAAAGQTLLLSEIARVACSGVAIVTQNVTNDAVEYTASFGAGVGTGNLFEAGIFNVVTANTATMLCRTVFAQITKGASDTMAITWRVAMTA